MNTMIPKAAARETRLSATALSGKKREQDHEGEHVGELAVDRVHEIALLGRNTAEGEPGAAAECSLERRQDVVLDVGDRPAGGS
jgi:hypothetical protein